jgi:acetolactate synthase-1/2/3 large subunit
MKISGGGLVAQTLKKFGIQQVYSLPGHQILSVYDACLDYGLELISTRHEVSTIYMAQALAYTRREPAAALLAGGPELTNALTGIAQAHYAGCPLLVISGTNTFQKRDKGFPQDMDQLQIVRPFTKWARSCHDIQRIPEYIATAYRHALRGRPGPAFVEIPYDLMEATCQESEIVYPQKPTRLRAGPDPSTLAELTRILAECKRPLAIAGSGVLWSEAEFELQEFTARTRIPLLLTTGALALPFPPEAVFGLGSMGAGHASLEAITEADVIILLGTRVNFLLGFGQAPFFSESQRIIQFDIDPQEIDTNRQVDLAIVGDLQSSLQVLNALDFSMPNLDSWRNQLNKKFDAFETQLQEMADSTTTPMHPMRLVKELESLRSDDSLLVLDGANSILWALLAARPKPAGGLIISTLGDLEAIGAGVPQALALKHAYPECQVILHTGDGSFGYGAMEMETAIRYGIPIIVVVHNDKGWGMTRDMQIEFFGKDRQLGNQLGLVRYDLMVEALGGYGEFVEQPEDLKPALERAMRSGLPACVNVMVDPGPKSPGLMMFMLMEVMLGKETYFDQLPSWMRKLETFGLDNQARKLMLKYIDRMLHKEMREKGS